MNRLVRCLPLVLLMTVAFASQSAYAIGIGGYLSGRAGSQEWDMQGDAQIVTPFGTFSADFDEPIDGDLTGAGLGFVLDTAPARNSVFSYRLNLGVAALNVDFDEPVLGISAINDELELVGITFDNSFGFKLFRVDAVRLWLGPRLRVGLYGGELGGPFEDFDAVLVELGAGGVFGANINIGDAFTIGVSGGLMYSGYAGVIDIIDDEELIGPGNTVFVNVSFMGRFGGDSY
jgi:hypothetical protein